MPIVQVPYGSANLLAQSDYQRINNLLATNFMNVNQAHWEDAANNIVQGAVFHVGGTVYYANAATAIGGVASDYIKLTPGGVTPNMTLTPSYVANLAGVTWNSAYNGYYDVAGNLYIFDEYAAVVAGEIAGCNCRLWQAFVKFLEQDMTFSGDPTFSGDVTFDNSITADGGIETDGTKLKTKVIQIGDWNMNVSVAGLFSVSVAHGVTDANIRAINVIIRADPAGAPYSDFAACTQDNTANAVVSATGGGNIQLVIQAGSFYDNAGYNQTTYNRGWITIIYEV